MNKTLSQFICACQSTEQGCQVRTRVPSSKSMLLPLPSLPTWTRTCMVCQGEEVMQTRAYTPHCCWPALPAAHWVHHTLGPLAGPGQVSSGPQMKASSLGLSIPAPFPAWPWLLPWSLGIMEASDPSGGLRSGETPTAGPAPRAAQGAPQPRLCAYLGRVPDPLHL